MHVAWDSFSCKLVKIKPSCFNTNHALRSDSQLRQLKLPIISLCVLLSWFHRTLENDRPFAWAVSNETQQMNAADDDKPAPWAHQNFLTRLKIANRWNTSIKQQWHSDGILDFCEVHKSLCDLNYLSARMECKPWTRKGNSFPSRVYRCGFECHLLHTCCEV